MTAPKPPMQDTVIGGDEQFTLRWKGYFSQLEKAMSPSAHPLTFAGLWDNVGGAYQPCVYWLDASGTVHLAGMAIRPGSITPGETIATLPPKFRPSAKEMFVIPASGAGGFVSVSANGVIAAEAGAPSTYFSLSGITFKAA